MRATFKIALLALLLGNLAGSALAELVRSVPLVTSAHPAHAPGTVPTDAMVGHQALAPTPATLHAKITIGIAAAAGLAMSIHAIKDYYPGSLTGCPSDQCCEPMRFQDLSLLAIAQVSGFCCFRALASLTTELASTCWSRLSTVVIHGLEALGTAQLNAGALLD